MAIQPVTIKIIINRVYATTPAAAFFAMVLATSLSGFNPGKLPPFVA